MTLRVYWMVCFCCLTGLVAAQATAEERAFIHRANEVRDSLGLEPLVLMEEFRRVSHQHANYIFRTEHVSHDQKPKCPGCRFYATHADRVEAFGPEKATAWAEILTFGKADRLFYHEWSAKELADCCVENFLGSELHRNILLSEYSQECTVAIIRCPKKYVCVVNFW